MRDDSWLIDYDALIAAFSTAFGRENVIAVSYEKALQERNSIIPAFLDAAGLRGMDHGDFESYWLNKS